MSLSSPSLGLFPSRRRRAASMAISQLDPYVVIAASVTGDSGPSIGYCPGISRSHPETSSMHLAVSNPLSHREPTRSFYHSSYHGNLAPVNSLQNARNIREDTAELASYALSDQASMGRSPSPRSSLATQSHFDTYFPSQSEDDVSNNRTSDDLRRRTIDEVSEPGPPEQQAIGDKPRSNSMIANLFRRPPENTSPPNVEDGHEQISSHKDDDGEQMLTDLSETSNGFAIINEQTPLLRKSSIETLHPDYLHGESDLEGQELRKRKIWPKLRRVLLIPGDNGMQFFRTLSNPKSWNRETIWQSAIVKPSGYIPAIILGTLVTILDALSYGMILFPLGTPIFEKLGSAGISMFYISCIVSQLVYSLGGSVFKGGIGSEMIEVVPFFHQMAFTIIGDIGEDQTDAIISTTITSYALSSILTGVVFFLMGSCHFGYIVGFIPRHILIGCIGGVGWFLVATGFEVTARLNSNLNYDGSTLRKMFELDSLFLWLIPLTLAIILYYSSKKITSKYYLPTFILIIPAVFYFFVFALDALDPEDLRQEGWIFNGPDAGEPWWYFYTLYDFKLVHWGALAKTIPAMFALTFFGILHVPINVPALAFSVGEDNLDLDRELVAHGVSNVLSGLAGSVQNYLVYTNSVLFIKSGGDSRVAGVLLAIVTAGIMIIGPSIVGFIPVMMVGVLIFVLGFELLFEAVWEPRKKLKLLEFLTVIAIVLIMGVYDFVIGIFVGIGLAFASLVVQTSRIPAVKASYSGEIAGSTVRRNAVQHRYLREVGKQIHVTKLAGYLFFGTIVSMEERIRTLIDDEAFHNRPIRFLLFDLMHVTGVDYSAAEAFNRINRIFAKKSVTIVMSGVDPEGPVGLSLRNVGLGEEGNSVKLHADLNAALEDCENELLKAFYASRDARITTRNAPSTNLDVPGQNPSSFTMDTQFSVSPRRSHLQQVANKTIKEAEEVMQPKWQNFKEPLRLILQTFYGLTDKNEDFWFRAVQYFTRKEYLAGTILFHRSQPANAFYLLEEGILRAEYDHPQGRYFESIVAGTTCGELPFFSETERTATVQAERDCIAWLMDRERWEKLQLAEPDVARELLRISLKLTTERMSAITSYVLTTAW